MLALTLLTAGSALAQAQGPIAGLYYYEVPKPEENRVYVFNTPEKLHSWEQTHDMGQAVTLVGAGPNGETIVAENDTAMDLYVYRHNLPPYERPTPKAAAPSPFPANKFGIRVFADLTNRKNKDEGTGLEDATSGTGIDVKRTYFTFTHSFDQVWSAQFQSDIGDQGARRYDVFVKKAFIEAKVNPYAVFRLGSDDLPWVPFVENIYGYRYVETVITDHLSFGTSADWGLHWGGLNNLVNYKFSVINGRGYSNPTRSKSVDFEGRFAVTPMAGWTFAVGGYSGKRGLDTDAAPAKHTASKTMALANYTGARFRIGGEWFNAKNWNNVTTVATDKADGWSTFGSFTINPQWAVFGRYDESSPSKDLKPALEWKYYNAGLQWTFNKAVQASLVYKHSDVEGGTVGTSNGTIGSNVKGKKGKYDEIGVWAIYNF
jgi:hypothetical protein